MRNVTADKRGFTGNEWWALKCLMMKMDDPVLSGVQFNDSELWKLVCLLMTFLVLRVNQQNIRCFGVVARLLSHS